MIWWCAEHKAQDFVQAWNPPQLEESHSCVIGVETGGPCRMVEALLIVKENVSEIFPLGVVNRFEVIDWTNESGRITSKWETYSYEVAFDIQDGGRTLKMFLMPLGDSQ